MISFCKQYFENRRVKGLEIGVASGGNAVSMSKLLNLKMLYLVDPYKKYYDHGNYITFYYDMKDSAKILVSRTGVNHKFIYKSSEEAVKEIPDNLDFIYIDGNHTYPFIKKDLSLYYPKVKPGGVFGGHDFSMHHIGVVQAVSEFIGSTHAHLFGKSVDWWVIK